MSVPSPLDAAVHTSDVILIVEDDESMREMIAKSLTNDGFEVLSASDTNDAFRLAFQRAPDGVQLVITDVVMPGMDGRDLARWMKGAYPKMKILFISGKPNHTLDKPGVLKPGTGFLRKPFSPSELAAKVRELLAE